jgi:hypothetical protein
MFYVRVYRVLVKMHMILTNLRQKQPESTLGLAPNGVKALREVLSLSNDDDNKQAPLTLVLDEPLSIGSSIV